MSLQIKDSYATVFDVEPHDNFVGANLSTGRKTKEVDENGKPKYVNSNWRATFVGACLEKAKALSQKDRIMIASGTISHERSDKVDPNTGKNKWFYNVTVFDFNKVSSAQNSSNQQKSEPEKPEGNGDDLPF